MTLYVGTSGWAYKEWKPDFYPQDLPQARFLEHYSRALRACEINATFYRLQSNETFARWSAFSPESFRFSVKAHRRLTHGKTVAPDAEGRSFLDSFLRSVGTLGPRLGVVLFQFPPYRHHDTDAFRALLDALPAGANYAFEFRHESWDSDAVRGPIAERGGTVCLSETQGATPPALPPGPFAYVRLRSDRYSEDARARWLDLLTSEARERDVFVFAKHEGIPAGDPFGGIGLAQWLCRQTER